MFYVDAAWSASVMRYSVCRDVTRRSDLTRHGCSDVVRRIGWESTERSRGMSTEAIAIA